MTHININNGINTNNGIHLNTNKCYLVYDIFKGSALMYIHSDRSINFYNNEDEIFKYTDEYTYYNLNPYWEYFIMSEDEVLDHYVISQL